MDSVVGDWLFVRDPMSRSRVLLPVYARASVPSGASLRIAGQIAVSSGKRVLLAGKIEMLVDSKGRMVPPPPSPSLAAAWPYVREVEMGAMPETGVPAPPDLTEGGGTTYSLTTEEGTVADAKVNGGTGITLEGKVVSAVFRRKGHDDIEFLYIYEPESPCGIKVSGSCGWEAEAGDLVDVTGDVISGAGVPEVYIDASAVDVVGTASIPGSLGMTNKAAVGAAFGLQPALYIDSSDSNTVGSGLNPVGLPVTLYGKVTSLYADSDGLIAYVDDGSGLKSNVAEGTRFGVKVLCWQEYNIPRFHTGDYCSVQGILGAEMSQDDPGVPVPVLWVPGPPARAHVLVGQYDSIQDAIDTADAMSPKGEVWVTAGTYHENINIPDGVAVYGGFLGTERKREQRDWAGNSTIIDGEVNNVRGRVVSFASGATATARIDGFTLRNGEPRGGPEGVGGAGVYCRDASACIANNIITDNHSYVANGSGICSGDGSPRIWRNRIVGNTDVGYACDGGGIYTERGVPAILLNQIESNSTSNGGGIYCYGNTPAIWRNTISDNSAHWGAGIWCGGGTPVIAYNTISGNVVDNEGGGVYCGYEAQAMIVGNVITENDGAYEGGGLFLTGGSQSEIVNNLFVGNSATVVWGGGGVAVEPATADIVNNTFIGNDAGPLYGGAVLCAGGNSDVALVNNIFCGNTAANGHCVALEAGATGSAAYCDAYPESGAYYNLTPGAGCITADPLFCTPLQYPYYIQANSPARGAGVNPSAGNHVPSTDVEYRLRPGTSGHTDMGAYQDAPGCP